MNWGVINWGIPLELTSVAKQIATSTPKDYIACYKRTKGLTMRAG